MPALIATLPRTGGNGRALFNLVGKLFSALVAPRTVPATTENKSVKDMSIWQLYRLTTGHDSINRKVAAELRRKLVEN
ncbi:MAG: hypothetical protein V7606_3517 [Burkholderiales bacterium]|jgi:hypothetical protein